MKGYFSRFKSAVVALSGGADSSFTLYLASRYIESKKIVAVTATNSHVFRYEINQARYIAERLNVRWIGFEAQMDINFFKNDENRCYYCKKSFLEEIKKIKEELGYEVIFDGSNIDDLSEVRPGRRAIEEYGVISPLIDLSLGKNDVLKGLNDSPLKDLYFTTESCKATRLVNIPIDNDIMQKIEDMEDILRQKIPGLRIRYNGKNFYYEIKKPHIISEDQFRLVEDLLGGYGIEPPPKYSD
ncbi:MAG: 7-cyano-7-deazaguanine synthase [Calditerrivibrio sp.]|uniref:7-cyano-7-deazaguanine synthase n=1 Tax=Calditerrivibrio sp. TaxID=2792612 RepID=UPI003D0CE6EB